MSKQYYKFMHLNLGKLVSDHGDHKWVIGKEYSVKGKIVRCENGFHASVEPLDALRYVRGEVLAIVEASGDHDDDSDKVCYRTMKVVKAYHWTKTDSVSFAIYCAERVLKYYEARYPKDSRPRDVIKAAKAYLKDPSKKNQDASAASAAAASAAYAAAYAASYAYAAAYASYASAAYASASAASASASASASAAYAAASASASASAAYASASAASASASAERTKINRRLKSQIKKLQEIT